MKRIKLKDRILPEYTKGEEIFNMVSHIVGGAIGIAILVLCIVFSAIKNNGYGLASGIVYGVSIIVLYTISSLYHGLRKGSTAKKVFQILDYCSTFLLIIGTYTPICLCVFSEYNIYLGWIIFGVVCSICVLGIIFSSIDFKKYRLGLIICYLLISLITLSVMYITFNLIKLNGFMFLLLGCLIYLISYFVYYFNKEYKWMHSIFHLFCVLGTILHGVCVLLYVI